MTKYFINQSNEIIDRDIEDRVIIARIEKPIGIDTQPQELDVIELISHHHEY